MLRPLIAWLLSRAGGQTADDITFNKYPDDDERSDDAVDSAAIDHQLMPCEPV
ncbi:hypothetical protein V1288_004900 [Bradyrhizobium sp. AZCC 2176]